MFTRRNITALFITLSSIAQSQEYEPFIIDEFERTSYYGQTRGGEGEHIAYFWSYISEGDTIINGKMYSNILLREDCFYEVNRDGEEKHEYSSTVCDLIGGIREENKRVLFYRYNSSKSDWAKAVCPAYVLPIEKEHLLFDFSLEEGDTVALAEIWEERYAVKIGEKKHELTGLKSHIMKLSGIGIDEMEWVESYGSERGLFASYIGQFTPYMGFDRYISCLKYQGKPIVDSLCGQCNKSQLSECELMVGTNEKKGELTTKAYPNPTTDEIMIESNRSIIEATIRNISGQVIGQYFVGGSNRTQIGEMNLKRGTMIIEILLTGGDRQFIRIVKL